MSELLGKGQIFEITEWNIRGFHRSLDTMSDQPIHVSNHGRITKMQVE